MGRAALRRASERQMRYDNVWQLPGFRPRLAIKLYRNAYIHGFAGKNRESTEMHGFTKSPWLGSE